MHIVRTIVVVALVGAGMTGPAHAEIRSPDEADRDADTLARMVLANPVHPSLDRVALARRGRSRRTTGAVLLGLGLPMLATGMLGAIVAFSADSFATLDCDPGACARSGSSHQALGIAGGVLAGAGLGGVVAGAVLLSMGRDDLADSRRITLSLAPTLAPDRVGLTLAGRF